jgi:hypothetical protein
MKKDIPTTQDKTLEEQAADLSELIMDSEREEVIFGSDTQKMAELEQKIALKKRLVLRMINGDEQESQSPLQKNHS